MTYHSSADLGAQETADLDDYKARQRNAWLNYRREHQPTIRECHEDIRKLEAELELRSQELEAAEAGMTTANAVKKEAADKLDLARTAYAAEIAGVDQIERAFEKAKAEQLRVRREIRRMAAVLSDAQRSGRDEKWLANQPRAAYAPEWRNEIMALSDTAAALDTAIADLLTALAAFEVDAAAEEEVLIAALRSSRPSGQNNGIATHIAALKQSNPVFRRHLLVQQLLSSDAALKVYFGRFTPNQPDDLATTFPAE